MSHVMYVNTDGKNTVMLGADDYLALQARVQTLENALRAALDIAEAAPRYARQLRLHGVATAYEEDIQDLAALDATSTGKQHTTTDSGNISQRLAAIRQRCNAATPGPWEFTESHGVDCHWLDVEDANGEELFSGATQANRHLYKGDAYDTKVKPFIDQIVANLDFAAHAREDIPWLLEQWLHPQQHPDTRRLESDWLSVFEDDELLHFKSDIAKCETPEDIRNIVHEWVESAFAVPILDAAIKAEEGREGKA